MKNTPLILAILMAFCTYTGAATYYIDYESGDDSASGLTKESPWKLQPYMNGFAGAYTHVAGDRFIFRGAVTWPNTAFPLVIKKGGSSESSRDYYGIDRDWFSGTSRGRPVFDLQLMQVAGNNIIVDIHNKGYSLSYITIEGFEVKNQYWQGPRTYGRDYTFYVGAAHHVTLRGLYVHGWQHDQNKDATNDNLKIVQGMTYGNLNEGSILEDCEFEGTASGGDSGAAVYAFPLVRNCSFHDMTNGVVSNTKNAEYYNNHIYNINDSFDPTTHTNAIELLGPGKVSIHGNIIHDITAGTMPIFMPPCGGNAYNNIIYDANTHPPISIFNTPLPGLECDKATAVTEIYNNTLRGGSRGWANCISVTGSGARDDNLPIGQLIIKNNLCIANPLPPPYDALLCTADSDSRNCRGVASVVRSNNLVMNWDEADRNGYSPKSLFRAPSAAGPAVDAGETLQAEFSRDIDGTQRPQGSGWDIGAYEYTDNAQAPVPTDSDGDGVPNTQDRCPKTAGSARVYVNVFGCAIPIATKFDIKPDFNSTDINGLQNLELGISQYGKISYANKNILLVKTTNGEDERLNIDADLSILQGKITLGQSSLPQLNAPATITFFNATFNSPKILKDGTECTACRIISYERSAKKIVFTVPGF